MTRSCYTHKALIYGNNLTTTTKLNYSSYLILRPGRRSRHDRTGLAHCKSVKSLCQQGASIRWISTPSATRAKKQALDRDVIVSVLESAATRRDAKGYLQKYTSKQRKYSEIPDKLASKSHGIVINEHTEEPVEAAIVKLRLPQEISSATLCGIAKTLSQLRALGLTALVVVDCGLTADRQIFEDEALRLCEAIDSFGSPGAKLVDHVFLVQQKGISSSLQLNTDSILVKDSGLLKKSLHHGMIVVIPSLARQDEISSQRPAEANGTTLALTKYLAGFQFEPAKGELPVRITQNQRPETVASVERVIILDPVGGTPMTRRPDVSHRLINLEQEYDSLLRSLTGNETPFPDGQDLSRAQGGHHAANLSLAKAALTFLPHTSSALITTPLAAANIGQNTPENMDISAARHSLSGFDDMVTTRKQKNPLLHNLLTNRPALSPSLPLQRIQGEKRACLQNADFGSATLVKRGMPVTIYPDPSRRPWCPAKPGSHPLRLTDKLIDLPRLVYLIEDSFNRKLDLQDYLCRVNDNLAGIIIAGEYEGAAILTWELPTDINEQAAHDQHRFVPYLDKFAVLKSQQGSSGVADIVFNAMVQNCFPDGVCWRSRKDNPVNKWYFERSIGTCQLPDSNWVMFWTTMDAKERGLTLQDYESVCRGVEPSWADRNLVPD
ncbi:Amino-acid acetyltransferase, mitochondrial [Conoideocrella luteorostrata]|uniref:Amino-acid acetyltransferase, mitochondrial n=1 Tax=Conoideocrella luteorostrata TaxID=1105319 RepID=A0AAJ0CYM1_9HYPO|nr:Amino-acid acetyltransferase, mitochondrial [Conoideocrella luteorostrata]